MGRRRGTFPAGAGAARAWTGRAPGCRRSESSPLPSARGAGAHVLPEGNPWRECRLRCDPLGLIYERLLQRLSPHCISGPPRPALGAGAEYPRPPPQPPSRSSSLRARPHLHPHFVQEIRLHRAGTRGPTFGSASRSLLSSGRPRPGAAPPRLLAGPYVSVRPRGPQIGEVDAARRPDRWGPRRFS